jgi:hypothetical protein
MDESLAEFIAALNLQRARRVRNRRSKRLAVTKQRRFLLDVHVHYNDHITSQLNPNDRHTLIESFTCESSASALLVSRPRESTGAVKSSDYTRCIVNAKQPMSRETFKLFSDKT